MDQPKSDVIIYAEIKAQPPPTAPRGKQDHAEVTSPDTTPNDKVIYSELRNIGADSDTHNVAPSNNLYPTVNDDP